MLGNILLKVKVVAITTLACVMILVSDHLPHSLRKKMLSKEYSGKDLEARLAVKIFSGWSTVTAIYHMLSVNRNPNSQVGQQVDDLKMLRLSSQAMVSMADLSASPSRPLILNFGSCT